MADDHKRIPTKPYYIADREPGFNVRPPARPRMGFNLPTPAGWMPADTLGSAAADYAASLVPSRQGVADMLGAPMDGAAWIARQLGAKGIPGGYAEADPITRAISHVTGTAGSVPQQMWKPSADVPLSSQNIQRMLEQPLDWGALLRSALSRPGRF